MKRLRLLAVSSFTTLVCLLFADPAPAAYRTVVLTDIGHGDPDDVQSFVGLLLYSNDLEIEGLLATASIGGIDPDVVREIIEAYGQVRQNLVRHADGYPSKESLIALVKAGWKRGAWRASAPAGAPRRRPTSLR